MNWSAKNILMQSLHCAFAFIILEKCCGFCWFWGFFPPSDWKSSLPPISTAVSWEFSGLQKFLEKFCLWIALLPVRWNLGFGEVALSGWTWCQPSNTQTKVLIQCGAAVLCQWEHSEPPQGSWGVEIEAIIPQKVPQKLWLLWWKQTL